MLITIFNQIPNKPPIPFHKISNIYQITPQMYLYVI